MLAASADVEPGRLVEVGAGLLDGEDRAAHDDDVVDAATATRSAAIGGAISGVMPAHGAISSHDSRSPTTWSAPTAARTAVSTVRARCRRSAPHSSPRWFVSPERNWRTRLCWPALISTPSQPASTAPSRGGDEAVDDGGDVVGLHPLGDLAGRHLGDPRRRPQRGLAVGRRALPAGVVERGDDERAVGPAGGDDGGPAGRRPATASGARSYGQSDGWTLAPSMTIVPQPPRARRS